jgi:hypothetical protein
MQKEVQNLQQHHPPPPLQLQLAQLPSECHGEKAYDHLEEEDSSHSLHISGTLASSILSQPTCHPKYPLDKKLKRMPELEFTNPAS